MTGNKKRILVIILIALITLIINSGETSANSNLDFSTYTPNELVEFGSLTEFYANPYIYCLNQGWHYVER